MEELKFIKWQLGLIKEELSRIADRTEKLPLANDLYDISGSLDDHQRYIEDIIRKEF